jgi:hypothetical protein
MVQYPFCCGTRTSLTLESATSRTRLGPECEGEHALLHAYKTADGSWLMLTATLLSLATLSAPEAAAILHKLGSAAPSLRAAVAAAEAPSSVRFTQPGPADVCAADDRLCASLSRAFASSGSASSWVQQLGAVGVRAVALASFAGLRAASTKPSTECNIDLRSDAKTYQFLVHANHPIGADLVMFAPCSVRTCGGEGLVVPLHDAPRYGEHTIEVLRSLGADWRALLARKQAATHWCASYLPGADPAQPDAIGRALSKATALENLDLPNGSVPATGILATVAALCEPISPRSSLAPAPDSCPICLDVTIRPVGLACSHQLCTDCATKCSSAGLASCPVCRHPQLLDPAILATRSQAWRAAYSGWRRGAPTGSQGEFGSINAPAGPTARPLSAIRLADTQVSYVPSSAGDLAISRKKTPLPFIATAGKAGFGGDQAGPADAPEHHDSDPMQLAGFVGLLSKPKRSFKVRGSQRMFSDFSRNSEVSLAVTCSGSPESDELV